MFTPGFSNNSTQGYHDYVSQTPIFSVEAGFYEDPQTLSLSCDCNNCEIRYSIDGDVPGHRGIAQALKIPLLIEGKVALGPEGYEGRLPDLRRPVKAIDILNITSKKGKEDEDGIQEQLCLIHSDRSGPWRVKFPLGIFRLRCCHAFTYRSGSMLILPGKGPPKKVVHFKTKVLP